MNPLWPQSDSDEGKLKDAQLDQLAISFNVAQFVSFSPRGEQRFSRIAGMSPNQNFQTPRAGLDSLLKASVDGRINLRSFTVERMQGNEFIYGIDRLEHAEAALSRLTNDGFFVIANETIDVNDGGVSGVSQGGIVEFAPGATPRVVETDKITSLPIEVAVSIFSKVYGFSPDLPEHHHSRLEFSLHPVGRGYRRTNTIIWEAETVDASDLPVRPTWPNSFSRFIGDKVFGLLIAEAIGFAIPKTLVLCRAVAPFQLGTATGSDVKWVRTAPRVPEPGFFPTVRNWTDPFRLMHDDADERIAAVLVQDEVPATFSGALISRDSGPAIVEGVEGFGDEMMLGRSAPSELGGELTSRLQQIHSLAAAWLGNVRMEWAFDGTKIWVLQLQQEAALSDGGIIVPGTTDDEVEFDVGNGLEALRSLIERIKGTNTGVKLLGRVGLTSHIADVLRRNRVPSRIAA